MNTTRIAVILCAGLLASSAWGADSFALAAEKQCFICHDAKSEWMIGPPFSKIAQRYKGLSNAENLLAARIQSGTEGHWAASKMPPPSGRPPVSEEEAKLLATYVLGFE